MKPTKEWQRAIPKDRIAHIIKHANRRLIKNLQERLDQFDISFGHWAILRVLWVFDGITQKELSLQTGLMESTVHTALRALAQQEIIERRRSATNLKNWYVFLTPKGKQLEAKLVPLAVAVNQQAVLEISEQDLQTTRKVLLQIITNLE